MRRPTNSAVVNFVRGFSILIVLQLIFKANKLQASIDTSWIFLKSQWVFSSVYFETIYVTILYSLLLMIPAVIDKIPWFDQFKIDNRTEFQHPTVGQVVKESIIYITPLALMDTFMLKWYSGVPYEQIKDRRQSWIQISRALPDASPALSQILCHLAGSLLIYDAIFFVFHLILHKNPYLYKKIHSEHHRHDSGLQGRITNQLSVVERTVLVLSANFSLKVLGAHPLTRFLYVPVFLWLLIENHWNYDFPCSYEKIIPLGIMGGSKYHYNHHRRGSDNYQPFFTYLDWSLNYFCRSSHKKTKTS